MRPTVSLEEAESYFATRPWSDVWDLATNDAKGSALAQASFLVSGAFVFNSTAWRVGETGETIWDDRIVAALCEEAIWLLKRDPSEIPAALFNGISQASAGAVSATFDKSFVAPLICAACKLLVGDLGAFIGDESAGSVATSLLAM